MKNLGELKTRIAEYVDREDLATDLPKFIRLAESKIYRRLRTRENEFTLQITEATTPEPISPIVLPQNFREFKLVTLNDAPVENISVQRFKTLQAAGYDGAKTYFTTIERKLHLYPWPTETQATWDAFILDVVYYGTESIVDMATWPTPTNPNQVPESDGTPSNTTLRGDDATTRLFLVAPDVYLYGAIAETYTYLLLPDKAQYWGGAFAAVLAELKEEHDLAEFSGGTTSVSNIYGDGALSA
jgi:hypothetical protein